MHQRNDRQSLPGAGVVQSARNSLFQNRSSERGPAAPVSLVDQPRPSSAEKYRRDLRLQAVDEADFPDPPPPAEHRYNHHDHHQVEEDQEEIHANHIYSQPAEPVRSVSEHRFKETAKPVEISSRANSCPDENELYSEVTVCMSQVKKIV